MRLDVWAVARDPLRLPAVGCVQVDEGCGFEVWCCDEVAEEAGVVEEGVG